MQSEVTKENNLTRIHIYLFAGVFALLFMGGLIGLSLITPVFKITAAIQVEKRELELEKADVFSEQTTTQLGNIVQKLKSSTLLAKVLTKLNYNYPLNSQTFQKMRKNLQVRHIYPSNTIGITFYHSEPREAAKIINALVEVLMEENLADRKQKVSDTITLLNNNLNAIKDEQAQLSLLLNQVNSPGFSGTYLNYDRELKQQLLYSNNYLKQKMVQLNPEQQKRVKQLLTPEKMESFKSPLETLEKDLVNQLIIGSWNNSRVKAIHKQLWREKVKIVETLKQETGPWVEVDSALRDDILAFYVKIYDLQLRQTELLRYKLQPLEKKAYLSEKQLKYQTLKELEDKLLKKLVELQSSDQVALTEITWIDKAVAPQFPYFPNIYLSIIISFGAAVFGGCLAVYVMVLTRQVN